MHAGFISWRAVKLAWASVFLMAGAVEVQAAQQAGNLPPDPVVMTDKGEVRGLIRDGVREFKGIPYAASPGKERRWMLPQPVEPWATTLDATQYKSACPQLARFGETDESLVEDCLHINVTTPSSVNQAADSKLPVIVWIHGGAFVGGSTSLYPLDYMARSGNVVVVSMNYRLGLFGF
ncbi:MAG: carboxylesterase family protein, partial [Rhodospirillales bacterium]|nr:carboxylesterase family protein [Rhodospirillales bacterium]